MHETDVDDVVVALVNGAKRVYTLLSFSLCLVLHLHLHLSELRLLFGHKLSHFVSSFIINFIPKINSI